MIKRDRKLLGLLIFVALLVGCGQMGPLYLPSKDTTGSVKSADTPKVTSASTEVSVDKSKTSDQSESVVKESSDETANNAQTQQNMQNMQNTQN